MCKGTLRSINDYFAHEEQTLLYLVSSEELEEREVGGQAHFEDQKRKGRCPSLCQEEEVVKAAKLVRTYSPQPINWKAASVETLIYLSNAKSEPPLTMNLSNREVKMLVEKPLKIPDY